MSLRTRGGGSGHPSPAPAVSSIAVVLFSFLFLPLFSFFAAQRQLPLVGDRGGVPDRLL
jgi:hypothetical protein